MYVWPWLNYAQVSIFKHCIFSTDEIVLSHEGIHMYRYIYTIYDNNNIILSRHTLTVDCCGDCAGDSNKGSLSDEVFRTYRPDLNIKILTMYIHVKYMHMYFGRAAACLGYAKVSSCKTITIG